MWKQLVKNKKLVWTAVVALFAGCALGVLVGLAINQADPEAEQTGRIGVSAVLPTTSMCREIAFAKCGHTVQTELSSAAFIGYTQSELQAFYEDSEISEFSGERVLLRQSIDTCCPQHVLLRAGEDGAVCVFQTDAEFFIEQLIRVIPVNSRADMEEQEQKRLTDGIVFDSLSDVDMYFESLES